jgi:hypothetical protein
MVYVDVPYHPRILITDDINFTTMSSNDDLLPPGLIMSQNDYLVSKGVLLALVSPNHSKYNYLFEEPVNKAYFPTYDEVIKRPMDFSTLRANLESGTVYRTRKEFYKDVMLIFDNAITFHSEFKDNAWIVKIATSMKKIAVKEKKATEKRLKGESVSSGVGGQECASISSAKAPSADASIDSGAPAKSKKRKNSSGSVGGESKKKIKLNLKNSKLKGSSSASVSSKDMSKKVATAASAASIPSEVVSSKKSAKSPMTTPTLKDTPKTSPEDSVKSKKPKLTLRLSVNKTASVKAQRNETPSSLTSEKRKPNVDKKQAAERKHIAEIEKDNKQLAEKKQLLERKLMSEKKQSAAKRNEKPFNKKSSLDKKSSADKKSIKVKVGAQGGASRGKELPKNVAGSNPKEKKSSSDFFFTSKPKSAKASSTDPAALSSKNAPSRGKELPSGASSGKAPSSAVAAPKASPALNANEVRKAQEKKGNKLTKLKAHAKKTQITQSIRSPPPSVGGPNAPLPMNTTRKAQCLKFLSALKRRKAKDIAWFAKPVNDPRLIDDYKAKIANPMDIGTLTSKLENDNFQTVPELVRDVRRIWGNCLQFNTTAGDSFRPLAAEMTTEAECLLRLFVQESGRPNVMFYPPLLYCWKLCLDALDALLGMKNSDDGLQTAHFFLHPASFYFGGEFPPDYKEKVQRPMDIGTVTSNLMEGVYQTVAGFVADCSLICKNCYAYNEGREDGAALVTQAKLLESLMQQQMGALMRYDQSVEGNKAKQDARTAPPLALIPRPPKSMLLSFLQDLRETTFTDRFTKITEKAAPLFEKPVDVVVFRDYPQFIQTPMNFETIEHTIRTDQFPSPEDFEYDVNLVFSNCEKYNAPKNNQHILALAKHLAKVFRRLYSNKMKNYEENMLSSKGCGTPDMLAREEAVDKKRQRDNSPSPSEASSRPPDSKKSKKDPSKALRRSISRTTSVTSMPPGDISIKSVKSSAPPSRASSPKPSVGRGTGKKGGKKDADKVSLVDQGPVTLPQANERVHAQYPVRRAPKTLQGWEQNAHRFYRDLVRHPWLSGSDPKFVFHAPVTTLFPEVADVYLSKIEKPMDLATAESKLLSGGLYKTSQDFVKDIALIFANAMQFNKIGRDDGVAMSCSYYEVSTHLLRYSRWLSLDAFSNLLMDDSEIGAAPKHGAYQDWKLTTSYKQAARTEMESIVLKYPIDKSEKGERNSWGEAEIEKLLKALKHQSDLKHMTYFIAPNFPGDYAAYVSKPMAREMVSTNLQNRKYETIGDAVDDLRLIFSNALKYNARAKDTETVSGRAYQAAIYMSNKFENAIQKMLLSASDRLEREHVEDAINERDVEAAERLEEQKRRAAEGRRLAEWKAAQEQKEKDKQAGRATEPVKVVKLKTIRRPMDFDFDHYEDDIADHKQVHIEATRHTKVLFEKQREYRRHLVQSTVVIAKAFAAKVYEKERKIHLERTRSKLVAKEKAKKTDEEDSEIKDAKETAHRTMQESCAVPIATKLIPGKDKIKMQLKMKPTRRPVPKAPITFMDDD